MELMALLWFAPWVLLLLVCIYGGMVGGVAVVFPMAAKRERLVDIFLILLSTVGVFLIGTRLASYGSSQVIFGEQWFYLSMRWSGDGSVYHVHNAAMLWALVPLVSGVLMGLVARFFGKESGKSAKQQVAVMLMSALV